MSGHRIYNSSQTHFYSATKYAVTAITEGIRNELRSRKSDIKITVSLVFSGPCSLVATYTSKNSTSSLISFVGFFAQENIISYIFHNNLRCKNFNQCNFVM